MDDIVTDDVQTKVLIWRSFKIKFLKMNIPFCKNRQEAGFVRKVPKRKFRTFPQNDFQKLDVPKLGSFIGAYKEKITNNSDL